jgi:hypothetical protein
MTMPSLELDHIFCFCSSALPEVALLEAYGFIVSPGRRHPGQGTANRCVRFRENYLEFIYVDDENEARANSLQLHRRAQWRQTGASPYGIALRGTLSELDRKEFWEYRPSYLPSGEILIHKSEDRGPLIFLVPSRSASAPPEHVTRTSKMTSVRLTGPGYRWPLAQTLPNISLANASTPYMSVEVDGDLGSEFSLNALLTVHPRPPLRG